MNEAAIINIKDISDMTKSEKAELIHQGYILGNICGKGKPSTPVVVKKDELRKSLSTYGRNAVFELKLSPDKLITVMVKEIQIKPMHTEYHHVDFQQISLSTKVKSDVSIIFTGVDVIESKRLLLHKHYDSISVLGLPQDIPDRFTVDVSNLKIGEHITVGDLSFSDSITPELALDTSIVSIGGAKTHELEEEKI